MKFGGIMKNMDILMGNRSLALGLHCLNGLSNRRMGIMCLVFMGFCLVSCCQLSLADGGMGVGT